MPYNASQPAAYPRAAAFAAAVPYVGGAPVVRSRRKAVKGHSLRAAWEAHGASPRRVAAMLALAHMAHCENAPLPWPRGFAPLR